MDHFAKPADVVAVAQQNRTLHRNFQGYTTKAGADLYGMGVTAISGFRDAYAQNFRELPAWEKSVNERGIATMRGYHLSAEDRLRREDGLLTIDSNEIRATWLGRIFIRNLAMLFDPYLEQQQLNAKPIFSKTL